MLGSSTRAVLIQWALIFVLACFCMVIYELVTNHPVQSMETVSIAIPRFHEPVTHTRAELESMAKNIYFESRGEPLVGQIAVGYVVLDRLLTVGFPKTIDGVIYQKSPSCQFSWTCQRRYPVRDQISWIRALWVAEAVLNGDVANPVPGALFFHATSVRPFRVKDTIRVIIQDHVFYVADTIGNGTGRTPSFNSL